MKTSKSLKKAFAFLIDNFVIYFVANILSTFLNPFAHSYLNRSNYLVIYVATLLIYITYSESHYHTTLGKKLLSSKK